MEAKTKIHSEEGQQELVITREFDLPVELLFTAYTEPSIVEQWMGTKVLKQESRKHGCYEYETTDPMGNKYHFHGTIHDIVPNEKITRTFEFENSPLDVQLEFLTYESLSSDRSKLTMHVIYRSVEIRDTQLKMPFAQGINMAHNRIEQIMKTK